MNAKTDSRLQTEYTTINRTTHEFAIFWRRRRHRRHTHTTSWRFRWNEQYLLNMSRRDSTLMHCLYVSGHSSSLWLFFFVFRFSRFAEDIKDRVRVIKLALGTMSLYSWIHDSFVLKLGRMFVCRRYRERRRCCCCSSSRRCCCFTVKCVWLNARRDWYRISSPFKLHFLIFRFH